MYKFLKKNAGVLAVLLVVALVVMKCRKSGYLLAPTPITISGVDDSSIFDTPYSLECVPGAPKGGAYTRNLTPGGYCGLQEKVAKKADYKIAGGIGGNIA